MEYIIKDLCENLMGQRQELVSGIADLNENLPNYSIKIQELRNAISDIDFKIDSYLNIFSSLEHQALNNEFNLKNKEQ